MTEDFPLPFREETDKRVNSPPPEDMWMVTFLLPRKMYYDWTPEAQEYYRIGWAVVEGFGRDHGNFRDAQEAGLRVKAELRRRGVPGRVVVTDSFKEPGLGDYEV